MTPARAPRDDHRRAAAILQDWFAGAARDLPWRRTPRNPYHALVAEAMLQQTQVSRAIAYFHRFIDRFPTLADLARADLDDVTALWSGLGYYRRARLLHQAARLIVLRFAGRVPDDPDSLRSLPGVGPYTAGAIASIVFGRREPIVDGNVMRVLLRVRGRDADPASPATRAWAWRQAAALVAAAPDPAAFNEGLMELGATLCLPSPRAPLCASCPWRRRCAAKARGTVDRIPRARRRSPASRLHADVVVVTRPRDHAVLLLRRSHRGMWAGLWECPTRERATSRPDPDATLRDAGVAASPPRSAGRFDHVTSHRRFSLSVWHATADSAPRGARWVRPADLPDAALSSAQRRAIALAGV